MTTKRRLVSLTYKQTKNRLTLADCDPGDYEVSYSLCGQNRLLRRLTPDGRVVCIRNNGSDGDHHRTDLRDYEVHRRLDGPMPEEKAPEKWHYCADIPIGVETTDDKGYQVVRLAEDVKLCPHNPSPPYRATGRIAIPVWE
jgi:hypothetical protein